MQTKIKIRFFGNEYLGGQFLQEIMQNHYDKFKVVGLFTNLNTSKLSFNKKNIKAKILFRKKYSLMN